MGMSQLGIEIFTMFPVSKSENLIYGGSVW